MPPCQIQRPQGTGDFLLMVFHDPASASTQSSWDVVQPEETMMIWPPRCGQYYGNSHKRYCHSWIHCDGARVRKIIRESKVSVRHPFVVGNSACFEQCLAEVHRELVSYVRPDAVIVGNLLENCLRDLVRRQNADSGLERVPDGLLKVRQLISEAPAREITLGQMAALAGMSIPNLSLRFKQVFGVSPVECLIQHRIHHAAHLLANQNLTVTEVGQLVGYDDPFHFSKMFKKHYGFSPRAMRQRELRT